MHQTRNFAWQRDAGLNAEAIAAYVLIQALLPKSNAHFCGANIRRLHDDVHDGQIAKTVVGIVQDFSGERKTAHLAIEDVV